MLSLINFSRFSPPFFVDLNASSKIGAVSNSGFDPYAVYAGDNAVNPSVPQESIATEAVCASLANLLNKNGFTVAANLVRQSIPQQSKEHKETGMRNSLVGRSIPTTYDQHSGEPIPRLQTDRKSLVRDNGRDSFRDSNNMESMW